VAVEARFAKIFSATAYHKMRGAAACFVQALAASGSPVAIAAVDGNVPINPGQL
jgi:hypothetical protein